MKRRDFLKSSLAASALAGVGSAGLAAAADSDPAGARQYYELRIYRLGGDSDRALLEDFLAKAAIPGLNRLGLKPIGAFTEIDNQDAPAIYLVIPYPTIESFATAWKRLNDDPAYQQAGAEYLHTPKTKPGFQRIDSWLLYAFSGMPQIELPVYSREKQPRIFELRTYESYSELKALKKISMFNSGEMNVMREVGLAPVFYGQALIGNSLPHLTYMLSAENRAEHSKHWAAFGRHPVWKRMSADPQYADTVSKITHYFLSPTTYSQI